ncbi:hypothetical protein NEIELOOT_00262 [Neisseria elongata subsp. glycolytica ATCC 29315]|uniref:Uncharacterized protein n=1 Tax=Neisseria elongata subsp. glycolytica ATCC 29315 TaxID=546263 RepID=D4DMJ3_NEIEG|nr:hypothetical protein NEIELOOT_00262 [Neisseria elongata subsp. glycolytica ATCC 29315]
MGGNIRPSEAVSSARKVSPAFFVLSDGLYPSVAVFIVGLGFQRCGKRQPGYGLYRFGHAAGQAAFRAAGGVAPAKLPFMPLVADACGSEVVAGVAAYGVAFGEARFIPQLMAEFDPFFGKQAQFLHFFGTRQRFEDALHTFEQLLIFR